MKGFYYKEKYYLLPNEYVSVEDMKSKLDGKRNFIRLKTNKCMPPFFIKDKVKEVSLNIKDVNRVYPVEVTLIENQQVYDDMLWELIPSTCKDCYKYEDEGKKSVKGHHKELSLDGVCFDRLCPKNDIIPFQFYVESFISKFIQRKNEFEEMIDKENYIEFYEELGKMFAKFMNCPFLFVTKIDNKYILAMSCLMDTVEGFVLEAIVGHPSFKLDGWEIYPYLPYPYFKRTELENFEKFKIKGMECVLAGYDDHLVGTKYDLFCIIENEEDFDDDYFYEIYFYLCELMGENVLDFAVTNIFCVNSKGQLLFVNDEAFELDRFERITIEDAANQLLNEFDVPANNDFINSVKRHTRIIVPNPKMMDTNRTGVQIFHTVNERLQTALLVKEARDTFHNLYDMHISIGSIEIKTNNLEKLDAVNITTVIMEKLSGNKIAKFFGIELGDDFTRMNYLVFNSSGFKKALRELVPVLKYYCGVYYELFRDEEKKYHIDFVFEEFNNYQ